MTSLQPCVFQSAKHSISFLGAHVFLSKRRTYTSCFEDRKSVTQLLLLIDECGDQSSESSQGSGCSGWGSMGMLLLRQGRGERLVIAMS